MGAIPEADLELAAFLRERFGDAVELCTEAFCADYPRASISCEPREVQRGWWTSTLNTIIDELETGNLWRAESSWIPKDCAEHVGVLSGTICNYIEIVLAYGRYLGPMIWRDNAGDVATVNRMLDSLERLIQRSLHMNLDAMFDQTIAPHGALISTWPLMGETHKTTSGDEWVPGRAFSRGGYELPIGAIDERPSAPRQAASRLFESLTSRDLDITRLVAAGMSNKEIATDLGIGVSTVKNRLSDIYIKTGTLNRAGLAAAAMREGLIADELG